MTDLASRPIYQGDTIDLEIPIYATGTTPAVLTAPTGVYIIAAASSAETAFIKKTGSFTQDGTSQLWTMAVALSSSDTAGLPVVTAGLYHQARINDSDGSSEIVVAGVLKIRASVPDAAAIAAP
jgi:hypothetical protein